MRRAWFAAVFATGLLGCGVAARAQIAHSIDTPCNCQPDGTGCHAPRGVLDNCPLLTQTCNSYVHGVVAAVQSCCVGFDGRHRIYRAAMMRNSFDRCKLLPFLPLYAHRDCRGCPPGHAGHVEPMVEGEEILEMPEVPEGTIIEPTPAIKPVPTDMPAGATSSARARQHDNRPTTLAWAKQNVPDNGPPRGLSASPRPKAGSAVPTERSVSSLENRLKKLSFSPVRQTSGGQRD